MIKKVLFTVSFFYLINNIYSQWNQINTGTNQDLYSVDYYDLNYIKIGSYSKIVSTNNGGNSWSINSMISSSVIIAPVNVYDVLMVDSSSTLFTGFFYGGNNESIYRFYQGVGWINLWGNTTAPLPRYFSAIDGKGLNFAAVGNSGRIVQSSNGGYIFNQVNSNTTNLLNDVKFLTQDTAYAVGNNVILKSTNGGANWTKQTITGAFERVSCVRGAVYVGKTSSNQLLKSINNGFSYSTITLPFNYNGVIHALNKDTILIAGLKGLYISKNGGQAWEKFKLLKYIPLNMIDFNGINNGIAVGDSGFVLKTSNVFNAPTLPIASFNVAGSSLSFCPNTTITLNNTTSAFPGYTYQWLLNNVPFSSQVNTSVPVSQLGNNILSLIVSNSYGSDTINQTITVIEPAKAFTVLGPDTICQANFVCFEIPNSKYAYQFKIGNTNIGNPIYSNNGGTLYFCTPTAITSTTIFTIQATLSTPCGTSTYNIYKTVFVSNAIFSSSINQNCTLYPNNISIFNGPIFGIKKFNLGNLSHTLPSRFSEYNNYTCNKKINLINGTNYPYLINASANFIIRAWLDYNNDNQFDTASEMIFSGISNPNLSGNVIIPPTFYLFNQPLRLRIATDNISTYLSYLCLNNGSVEVRDYLVEIKPKNVKPQSQFTYTSFTFCDTEIKFENSSFNATSYLWDFGDGDTSTFREPIHYYKTTGTYSAKLVTHNLIGSDTLVKVIVINNPRIPKPAQCRPPSNVSNSSPKITFLQVNNKFTHNVFNGPTDYGLCNFQVHLIKDSTYYLQTAASNCNLTYTGNCYNNIFMDFNNDGIFDATNERIGIFSGCSGSNNPGGIPFIVLNTSVVDTPIRARILTNSYCSINPCDSSSLDYNYVDFTVFVHNLPPNYSNYKSNSNSLILDTTKHCVKSTIQFNSITQTANSYYWNFDDGFTSNSINPTHTFQTAGVYYVKLKTCNFTNVCDSTIKKFLINALPNVSIALNPDTVCKNTSQILLSGGIPSGGVFSGLTVVNNIFFPNSANLGNNSISYAYKDNNDCINKDSTILFVDLCLGLQNLEKNNKIIIYPTITSGLFDIELLNVSEVYKLKLFDIYGKNLLESTIGKSKTAIDIANFANGLYSIQIYNDKSRYIGRIIKQ
jgi:PKD repeat protein